MGSGSPACAPRAERLHQLRSLKRQRLEKLEELNQGISAVAQWVQENRAMFKGEVFGPLITEVTDIVNPVHASMLEQAVKSAPVLRSMHRASASKDLGRRPS